MDESVRLRVDTNLPVGVIYSGGLDSSLVLARKWKIRDGWEKWILRQAFGDLLPGYILKRHKNPLSHSSGLHEAVRMQSGSFRQIHNRHKLYLHEALRKDFSVVLREQNYDLDKALEPKNHLKDFSLFHHFLEFWKGWIRYTFLYRRAVEGD